MGIPVQYSVSRKAQRVCPQGVIFFTPLEDFRRKRTRPSAVKEGPVLKGNRTPSLTVIKDIRALAAKGKSLPVGSRNIREDILSKKNMQKLRGHTLIIGLKK
jgi:hypothetical protein